MSEVKIQELLSEWVTSEDTSYLLGAGCSDCAGSPMIAELTKQVLHDVDENLLQQFRNLQCKEMREPTVEDLMSFLVKFREILTTQKDLSAYFLSIEEIDNWLKSLKDNIVVAIHNEWRPSEVHERFFRRIRSSAEPAATDVFTLNYDSVIEASLDSSRIPYVDGFQGTNRAWFDPETFDVDETVAYRLFKLHGSINWVRDDDGYIRRTLVNGETSSKEPVVVYPSEQKYVQTQFGVYETLMGRFRDRLRRSNPNNMLVVIGYSFNDEHINHAIVDSITTRGSNLTVIAFVGPDESHINQQARLTHMADRCDQRLNFFVGDAANGQFIGNIVDTNIADSILKYDFWRFENLVGFIAGESNEV